MGDKLNCSTRISVAGVCIQIHEHQIQHSRLRSFIARGMLGGLPRLVTIGERRFDHERDPRSERALKMRDLVNAERIESA